MTKIKKISTFFGISLCLGVLLGYFLHAPAVYAECADGCVETAILGNKNCSCDTSGSSILGILQDVLDIFSIIVGVLGAIGIILVSIQYVTAGGDEARVRKSKRRLLEITIGLAAYFCAFGIFSWLNVAPGAIIADDGMNNPSPSEEVIRDEESGIAIRYDTAPTSEDIAISVSITNEKFFYLKNPDGTINTSRLSTYKVSENGSYTFTAYDEADKAIGKATAIITNIDKSQAAPAPGGSGDGGSTSPETPPASTGLEIHFIVTYHDDDAILIRDNNNTIMIDGGRIRNKDKIIPYLKDLGVTTIDAIIGSHVQYNHSQAHAAIVENFNVKKAYYPVDPNNCVKEKSCESRDVEYHKDALKKYGINTEILRASSGGIPRKIQIGAMELYFLYPVKIGTSQNGNSFIFILKYKNNTFMFTGDTPATNVDASSSRLKAIKDNAKALGISLDVDVLKWPHHGNSTVSKAFLDVVKPEYTIIPNFGHSSHPTSENRSKVEKAGSKIYELKKHGNIVILSNGNKIEIKTNQKAADYKR